MDSRPISGEGGALPISTPLADLGPGHAIGEYRVVEKLGQGGFGTVYSALHPLIGKTVAVKVLSREFSANPDMISRFVNEARAVNTIRHRNIIDIFNFGKLPDGRQFFVMELLEGISFERFLAARGALEPALCVAIMRDVARALDAAHRKGIVHRDLKPDNIYLIWDDDGRPIPKLLDFGIAKLLGDHGEVSHKTRTGSPVGTPHYMAPEQCLGEPVDERVDIYAFGVVCFEALTGHPPFSGKSFLELMNKQAHAKRPQISTVRPELGTCFDAAVQRMMAIERDARPQTPLDAFDLLVHAAQDGGYEVDATPIVPESFRRPGLEASGSFDAVSEVAKGSTGVPVSTVIEERRTPRGALLVVGAVFGLGVAAYVGVGRLTAAPTPEPSAAESAPAPAPSPCVAAGPPIASAPTPTSFAVQVELRPRVRGGKAELVGDKGRSELGAVPGKLELEGKRGDRLEIAVSAPGFVERIETVELPPPDKLEIKLTPTPRSAPKPLNKELEDPFK